MRILLFLDDICLLQIAVLQTDNFAHFSLLQFALTKITILQFRIRFLFDFLMFCCFVYIVNFTF